MTSLRARERHASTCQLRSDIERRVIVAREILAKARDDFHAACRAVTEAERVLLERRIEREQAATKLARLADALESLERTLDKEPTRR